MGNSRRESRKSLSSYGKRYTNAGCPCSEYLRSEAAEKLMPVNHSRKMTARLNGEQWWQASAVPTARKLETGDWRVVNWKCV